MPRLSFAAFAAILTVAGWPPGASAEAPVRPDGIIGAWQRTTPQLVAPPTGGWSTAAPDLRAMGAVGDGQHDDTDSFGRWWAAAVAAGQGHVPAGHFHIRARELDLAPAAKTGVRIWGDGAQRSVLMVEGGGLRLVSGVRDTFYARLVDIGVAGTTDGPVLELGRPDFSDALNSITLDNVVVNNLQRSAAAIGLQANGVYAADFRNLVVNNAGQGTAIRLRQTQFSRFQGAAGNASVALHLTAGYNTGNTFAGFDFEEVDTDVVIDSASSVNNVFLGNQYVWHRAAIDASAGNNNLFIAPNLASGGIGKALARSVGIQILGNYGRPGDAAPH